MRFQIKHQNIIGKSKERERLYEQIAENDCVQNHLKPALNQTLSFRKKWRKSKKNQLLTLGTSIIPPFHHPEKNSKVKTSKSKTI